MSDQADLSKPFCVMCKEFHHGSHCSVNAVRKAFDVKAEADPVNHPSHYQLFPGQEAIDVIKAALTPEEFAGYLKGNCLKYRLRAGNKGDTQQDIDKSNWYRRRLVDG